MTHIESPHSSFPAPLSPVHDSADPSKAVSAASHDGTRVQRPTLSSVPSKHTDGDDAQVGSAEVGKHRGKGMASLNAAAGVDAPKGGVFNKIRAAANAFGAELKSLGRAIKNGLMTALKVTGSVLFVVGPPLVGLGLMAAGGATGLLPLSVVGAVVFAVGMGWTTYVAVRLAVAAQFGAI